MLNIFKFICLPKWFKVYVNVKQIPHSNTQSSIFPVFYTGLFAQALQQKFKYNHLTSTKHFTSTSTATVDLFHITISCSRHPLVSSKCPLKTKPKYWEYFYFNTTTSSHWNLLVFWKRTIFRTQSFYYEVLLLVPDMQ